MPTVLLTRKFVLRALHNLENPDISDAENEQLYGLCYRLHGHDYKLHVTLQGGIAPNSGLIFDRTQLDSIVNREIIKKYEGKNLNLFFENTSGEALVREFFKILKPHFPSGALQSVSVQETRKNWFSVHSDLMKEAHGG